MTQDCESAFTPGPWKIKPTDASVDDNCWDGEGAQPINTWIGVGPADSGKVTAIVVGHDYSLETPELDANAMAIGAGYPFMGAESKDMPFAPQCFQIELPEKG